MLVLLADENLNNDILRGLFRRRPDLDIVRVLDVGLSGATDPEVLEWAAQHERILLTHDVSTVSMYAFERVKAARPAVTAIRSTNCPRCSSTGPVARFR